MLSCFSHVWFFATSWTEACQAPLSMEFSRQEYWSGLSFPLPGDLPNPGIEPAFLHFLQWQVSSLPLMPPGNPIRASCLSNLSTVLFQRMIYIWYDMIHILFALTIISIIYFETYLQDICSRAKSLCLSQASLKAVPPFGSESVDPMICETFMVDQDVCKDLTEKAEERGWRKVTDPSSVFSSSHGGKKKQLLVCYWDCGNWTPGCGMKDDYKTWAVSPIFTEYLLNCVD